MFRAKKCHDQNNKPDQNQGKNYKLDADLDLDQDQKKSSKTFALSIFTKNKTVLTNPVFELFELELKESSTQRIEMVEMIIYDDTQYNSDSSDSECSSPIYKRY